MRNQGQENDEDQEQDRREGGMTKYARGGIAITIASAPQDERERTRSGSQPRYPYQDSQPF